MWAAQYFTLDKPRCWLTSGGLGTMGYGFPAAIGAQAAFPDDTVIDIAGDGSIQMNIQELATAVQYKLPVKIAILNNRYLGMVRQWQELFYGKRYSHTVMDHAPDFVKLAEAYGALGLRADQARGGAPGDREGPGASRPGDHGLPGGPRRRRLSDGAGGRPADEDAPGVRRESRCDTPFR